MPISVNASQQELASEYVKIFDSFEYFCDNYGSYEDKSIGGWNRFGLWPSQRPLAQKMPFIKKLAFLKARQLGATWMALNYAIWLMLTNPGITVLLFSLRDTEAKELLVRLKGVYAKLPDWLKVKAPDGTFLPFKDDAHDWRLHSGSEAKAFSTKAGDSYTARLAIVDEADLGPDLNRLLKSVQPTIDANGQLFLISKADKSKPDSEFKQIYRAAEMGENTYTTFFLPWNARPDRTQEWYDQEKRSCFAKSGTYDDIYENYPETSSQALAPTSSSKRIPWHLIEACLQEIKEPLPTPKELREIPNIKVYKYPTVAAKFSIGADPAQGNPTSDDSAISVLDACTNEEVCQCAGKFDVAVFGRYINMISNYYNRAVIMVERNNHGHAVILWLRQFTHHPLLFGIDGKPGWSSSVKGKSILYDEVTQAIAMGEVIIHNKTTADQLGNIEAATMRAPEGPNQHDDYADAFALAYQGSKKAGVFSMVGPSRPEEWAINYDGMPQFGAKIHPSDAPMGVQFQNVYKPFGVGHATTPDFCHEFGNFNTKL